MSVAPYVLRTSTVQLYVVHRRWEPRSERTLLRSGVCITGSIAVPCAKLAGLLYSVRA